MFGKKGKMEKYGEDYTLEYTGGGSLREIGGRNGLSGTGSYECTINGTDQFSVALTKEKEPSVDSAGRCLHLREVRL